MKTKISEGITSQEFDEKFDAGEDVSQYLDFSQVKRKRLPAPEELIDDQKERVTLVLRRKTLESIKSFSHKHRTSYQKMIRKILDAYANQYFKS
jgi:predicted DNA binding CopG/RHH family protein